MYFSDKLYHKLFTKDDLALQWLGYELADEHIMEDIKDDFDRLSRSMRTKREIDDMFDNHGENYIPGFYLRKMNYHQHMILKELNL